MFLRFLALFACCQLLETASPNQEDVPLPPPPRPPTPPPPPRNAFSPGVVDEDEEDHDVRQHVFQAMNNDARDGNEDDFDEFDEDGCDDVACSAEGGQAHRPWKAKEKIPVQSKKAMKVN